MVHTAFRTTPKTIAFNSPFQVLNDVLTNAADEFYHTYNSHVNGRPAVNIKETQEGFEIALAAPGLTKSDFELSLEKNTLTISVKKEVAPVEGERVIRKEFNFHNFTHSFKLADVLNTQSINANYDAGILTIKLAKKPEVAPQKINIA